MTTLLKRHKRAFALAGLLLSSHLYANITGTVYKELPVNSNNSLNTYGQKESNEPG